MKELSDNEKRIVTYAESTLVDLYEKLTENKYNTDMIRGEILALNLLLKKLEIKPIIKIILEKYKEDNST